MISSSSSYSTTVMYYCDASSLAPLLRSELQRLLQVVTSSQDRSHFFLHLCEQNVFEEKVEHMPDVLVLVTCHIPAMILT